MVGLIGTGIEIVAIAAIVIIALAWAYPLWALGIGGLLYVMVRQELKKERARLLTLDRSSMSPVEYEHHCAELLRQAGWNVRVIGGLSDQGVDVLAELRGIRAAVQCKRYGKPAGNAAVQEVVAGKRHYGAQIAVVVCPVGYTRSAQELADSNGVLLLSEAALPKLERLARVP